jgi:hypothetical protein
MLRPSVTSKTAHFLLSCEHQGLSIRGHCAQNITNMEPVMPTRGGGSRYKLLGPGSTEGDSTVLHVFLFFSVLPLFVY